MSNIVDIVIGLTIIFVIGVMSSDTTKNIEGCKTQITMAYNDCIHEVLK